MSNQKRSIPCASVIHLNNGEVKIFAFDSIIEEETIYELGLDISYGSFRNLEHYVEADEDRLCPN